MILRQSTAVAISFGSFVSPTDGATLQTGLVSAIDHASTGIKLSKNGGALTIRHASVTASTYDGYGNYIVTLDTTDTNTVGRLRVQFAAAASCLPVWADFDVVEEAVYDALYAASAAGYGTAQTGDSYALANGANGFAAIKAVDDAIKAKTDNLPAAPASTTNITAGTITTVTNLTNAPTNGDLTAAMKTSVTTAATAATPNLNAAYDAAKTAAQAGNAMTLTSGERTAIANEVEAQIIDDTDSEKVLTAITNKIAAVNPDLGGLTVGAIAAAAAAQVTTDHGAGSYIRNTEPPSSAAVASQVRTELTTELGRVDVAVSTRLASLGYTAPDNASVTAIKAKTDLIPGSPASTTNITAASGVALTSAYDASKTAATQTSVDDIPTNSELATALTAISNAIADKTGYRLSATGVNDLLRTALTEGYAADGAAMTVEQALHMIWSMLCDKAIVGTTLTTRKLDGTTAAMTFTLNSDSAPTSQVRAT